MSSRPSIDERYTAPMEKLYRDMIMNRSGAERLKMGCSMHNTAKKIVRASILQAAPQTTE